MLPTADGTVAVAPEGVGARGAVGVRGAVEARGGRIGRETGVRAPQPIGAGRQALDGRRVRAVG